jgi:hypothetical protein
MVLVGGVLSCTFFLLCIAFIERHVPIPHDPLDSVFLLHSDGGICTSFLANGATEKLKDSASKKYVYTAAHCISQDMTLEDRHGRVSLPVLEYLDKDSDLAILTVEGIESPELRWGKHPSNNDAVTVVGYLADVSPVPVVQPLRVAFSTTENGKTGPILQVHTIGSPIWPGTSGGPLLNGNGEVVGIALSTGAYLFGETPVVRELGCFGMFAGTE